MNKLLIIFCLAVCCTMGKVFGQTYFGKRVLVSYNLLTNNVRERPTIPLFSTSLKFRFTHSAEVEYMLGGGLTVGGNLLVYRSKFQEYTISSLLSRDNPVKVNGLGYGIFFKTFLGSTGPFGTYIKFQYGSIVSNVKSQWDPENRVYSAINKEFRIAIGRNIHLRRGLLLTYGIEGGYGPWEAVPTRKRQRIASQDDREELAGLNLVQHLVNLRIGLIFIP